jgi:hypothetical protein
MNLLEAGTKNTAPVIGRAKSKRNQSDVWFKTSCRAFQPETKIVKNVLLQEIQC